MRISVIVPAYNAARTVTHTLDALLAQSCQPDEIIVVDDGSHDETREVLETYRGRVRLVFQANGGVSAARNRGVTEATGDWIAFCDADDLWHPEKLRVLSAVLASRTDMDLVFHEFWTLVDGLVGEPRATHSPGTMFPIFGEVDISIPRILPSRLIVETGTAEFGRVSAWHGFAFRWLMFGNFLMPSTVLMRRAAFNEAGGFDAGFRYAEDTEFFLRFGRTRAMVWVDCPLTGYRRERGSLLTSNMLATMENATKAVVKHCVEDKTVYDGPDRTWVRRAVARRFARLAYFCLSEVNPRDARKYAAAAIGHRLSDLRAWGILLLAMLPVAVLKRLRLVHSTLRSGLRRDDSQS